MKKITVALSILLALNAGNLYGQTEKGTLMLGGNLSFQAGDEAVLFIVNPAVGVFLREKLAVGVNASLLSSEGYTQWSLGPFARYYFGNSEKGKPFGQGAVSVYGGDDSDLYLGGGLTGGYAIFLNPSIALEFSASYFRISDSGLFILGAGFQVHFRKGKTG